MPRIDINRFQVRLDLDKESTPKQLVRLRQGDRNGTSIVAAIYSHGLPVSDVPDACHFVMRLPDGEHYYRKSATWDGGTATVVVDEAQAASATGCANLAYFQLTYGALVFSTGSFTVTVEPDAVGDAELPEDYDSEIQDAIDRCNAAAAAIEGALPIGTANLANGAVTADKLADAVRKGYVRSFETVAAMQAATYLEDGMTCHTNGFHAAGDGGAAYYVVGTMGTANSMDVLALQGGLFASLVTSDRVSPEQLGAYGNGTSDDTASFVRSFAIASIISLSGGKTYVITDKITSASDIKVYGNGATILNKSGNASATVDYIFSFDNDETQIDSVNFDSNNQSRGSINFTGGTLRVTNCSFTGYSAAYGHYQTDSQVWADHFEHAVFDNDYFHDNGYSYGTVTETLNRCITVDGGTGTAMITNCIFERVNQAIVDACTETIITGCAFTEHSDNAIYDSSDTTLISNTIFNATNDESIITQGITEINNCRFLNVVNRCVGIDGAMELLAVKGCSFVATNITVMGIVETRADTNVITHCVFTDNVVLLNDATLNYCLNFGEVQYFHFTGNHISGSATSQGSSSMVRVINAIEYIIKDNIIHQNTSGINLFISVTPLDASTSVGVINDNISDERIRYYPLSTPALHSSKLYRQSNVGSHFQGVKVPSIITSNMSTPPADETYPAGTIMVLIGTGAMYTYTSANTWVQV